jgi:hypothetical protein
MQQHLKSNLLEFLCLIRSKLIVFRSIEELKNILDQIDSNTNSQSSSSSSNVSMNSIHENNSSGRIQSTNVETAPSIGFSHLLNNPSSSSSENSLSPGIKIKISLELFFLLFFSYNTSFNRYITYATYSTKYSNLFTIISSTI